MYQYGDGTEPKTRTKVNQRKPTEHNPGGTKRKKKTELKIRLALPLGKVLLAFAAQNSHCPFEHSSHNTPALGHRSFPVRGRPCETISALSTVTGYTRREKTPLNAPTLVGPLAGSTGCTGVAKPPEQRLALKAAAATCWESDPQTKRNRSPGERTAQYGSVRCARERVRPLKGNPTAWRN